MTDKFILPNESPQERLSYLEDTADQIVEETYYHRLSSEELIQKRAEFTRNALEMDDLEEQKKEVLEDFKQNLQPKKETHKKLGSEIRTGYERKEGRLFKFVDYDTKFVHFYDTNGELIETKSRPATAEDMQKTIQMSLRRTGTEN